MMGCSGVLSRGEPAHPVNGIIPDGREKCEGSVLASFMADPLAPRGQMPYDPRALGTVSPGRKGIPSLTTSTDESNAPSTTGEETQEERRRQQIEKNQAAIARLRSWRETTDPEEIQDQKETWEFLKQALDEDRLSYRKLFP